MEFVLERPSMLAEDRFRNDHNARIKENYNRIVSRPQAENGGYAQSYHSGYSQEYAQTEQTQPFTPIENYDLLGSNGITYEEAQRYAAPMQQEENEYISAARNAANSEILTSSAYSMAAMRREEELRRLSEERFNATVPTTEQATIAVNDAVRAVAEAKKAEKAAQGTTAMSAQREYYMNLAKKAIILFAVAFAILVAVISFNSAVLNGMTVELSALESTLQSLQLEVENLAAQIEFEKSWESIYAYIQANGLLVG